MYYSQDRVADSIFFNDVENPNPTHKRKIYII